MEALFEDCWSSVKAAINKAAEGATGFVEGNLWNYWFDEKCQPVLDMKKKLTTGDDVAARNPSKPERFKQKRT